MRFWRLAREAPAPSLAVVPTEGHRIVCWCYPLEMSLLRVLTPLTASVDRLFSRAVTGRGEAAKRRSRAESLGHEERLVALSRIAEGYAPEAFDPDLGFFSRAPDGAVKVEAKGRRQDGAVRTAIYDLSWRSNNPLHSNDTVLRERYERVRENQTGWARAFIGDDRWERPTAIIVHGYRAGQFAVEERVWPLKWLLEHGMNAVLLVLPFHALRSGGRPPAFPGSDPRFTNEGFRQAVFDARTLIAYLESRGAPAIGAMGMSLGGYTVSLLGTLLPSLSFLAPIIPLASFADVALAAGRLVGSPEQQALQQRALENAHRIASPFSRPPRIAGDSVVVIAGEGDQITPLSHAEKLRDHFNARYVTFAGGHILQLGRADGFRAVGALLREKGLFR